MLPLRRMLPILLAPFVVMAVAFAYWNARRFDKVEQRGLEIGGASFGKQAFLEGEDIAIRASVLLRNHGRQEAVFEDIAFEGNDLSWVGAPFKKLRGGEARVVRVSLNVAGKSAGSIGGAMAFRYSIGGVVYSDSCQVRPRVIPPLAVDPPVMTLVTNSLPGATATATALATQTVTADRRNAADVALASSDPALGVRLAAWSKWRSIDDRLFEREATLEVLANNELARKGNAVITFKSPGAIDEHVLRLPVSWSRAPSSSATP